MRQQLGRRAQDRAQSAVLNARCRLQNMENQTNFLAPGSDGDLDAGADIWRKGLVYTRRSPIRPRQAVEQTYRVSVAFKRRVGASSPFSGYRELYRRVRTVATWATSELTCLETGEAPTGIVVCHGWRSLGEGGEIATAFITVDLRCSERGATEFSGEPEPTEETLRSPGGATLEELARIAPQRADEFYNEFDFTEPSTADTAPVTLSYGEPTSGDEAVDFQPFVERAERLARDYYTFLQSLGEAHSNAFRVTRREWFLADQGFITIHVCFDR